LSNDSVTSLHYAANGNLVESNGVYTYAPVADGFNLADVGSLDELNALPAGVKGLVYLGMTDGVTAAFKAAVDQYIGNPKLYGFYVADQPTTVPAANIKAEADYIHANVPGAITFMWIQNTSTPTSPVYNLYNPQNTDIDLFGISPQAVRPQFSGGMDLSVIPDAVNAAVAGGIPLADIVPIYQAFGGGGVASSYTLPTASQEQLILSTWGAYVPNPAFDFAYSWGVQNDNAISNEPSLQQVFAAHNAQAGSITPAPTITSPANGSTDTTTATPTISGTGVVGDTVTLSIDGTQVTPAIAVASNNTWTYTPTAALSNGAHTLTATQAASGGPSSTAATDTFTVNVGTAPAAPTITRPANGSTDTTTATPTISGGGVTGDTVTVSIDGTVAGTAPVVNGAWSFTPTSALSNASHTITAMQAAPGGASSTAASDTFTVNVAGQTISTASGNLYLTSASNPLTITSTGSVTATSGDAISAPAGTAWQINNAGTISGVIGTSSAGIYSPASGVSVQNTGKISGAVAGLYLSNGGTVTNGANGLISATGSYGIYVSGAAGVVTNLGTITGASYAVDLTFSSASNRVVVAPGAVFNGLVSGGNGTLELAAGSGAAGTLSGTIGGTSGSFRNFSQLVIDPGASWSLSGALQITTIQIGGSLEVASDTTPSSQINFGSGAKLTIDNAASFAGALLSNFATGDIIDIKNFSAAGATISYNSTTGVAQISNGSQTATLDFKTSTLGAGALQVASDGGTGVVLTLSQTTAPPAPTITSPANGSTDTTTATPTISGGGVGGDTVTVSIDGTVAGTAPVVSGAWSFTPTSGLSNASHTITATQAAAGGPSSTAASDTFIVNVGGGGLTISSAVTGPLSLTATNNPLTITSAGSVKATASGADAIDGGSGAAWSINNSGTVASSQRYGVSLHGAGSILNSGSISGYSGEGGYGVDLEAGGTVTNTSTGYISGGEDAIFVYGAAGAINNSGQIVSTFDDGLVLYGGGSVINNAGGVIQAPTGGGFGPAGVYIPSGSANVVNRGSITGQYGVYLGAAGTVENAGTISGSSSAVTFAVSSAANRLIVDPGAVFSGSVKGNGGVLELTAGTGSIGSIGSSPFSGFQTLIDDLGGDWTLTGSNTIANVTNNGSLVVAGSLHVTTAVNSTSTGEFELQAGAALEVAADSAANSQIDFRGASQLIIDNAALFGTGVGGSLYAGPQLEDFGVGDIVDLYSFSAAAAALLYNPASGLLQVTNGSSQVATLDFQNSTLGSGSFSFASDGGGGIKVTHS
jgi:hypothetical protein